MHEDLHVAFGVEVGVGAAFYANDVNLGARGEGVFEHASGFDVAHLGANEGGAFAGFDVEEFNDGVDVVIEIDAESVFNVSCCCHNSIFIFLLLFVGGFLVLFEEECEAVEVGAEGLVFVLGGEEAVAVHEYTTNEGY